MPRALSQREVDRIVAELSRIHDDMEKYADQLEDRFNAALVKAHSRSLRGINGILSDGPDFRTLNAKQRMAWWIDHKNAIEDALVHSGYKGAVVDYVAALPAFAALVNELASAQGESFISFPQKTLEFLKGRATQQFVAAGVRGNQALLDVLYAEVFSGRPSSATVEALREALPEVYQKYAGTYARTNHFRFARELSMQQADANGTEFFLYTGPVDEKNRPFCRSLMANPVHTRAEIAAMDNHQGPEVADVMTNGGGWNCRHKFVGIGARLAQKLKDGLADAPSPPPAPETIAARGPEIDLTTPPAGWKAFKTTAQAQQWANENKLATDMVDYAGLHVSFANKLNYEIAILVREFPQARTGFVGSQLSSIEWLRSRGFPAVVKKGTFGGYRALRIGDGMVTAIVFPQAKYGSPSAMAKSLEQIQGMIDTGWMAQYESDDLLRRVIYHEFGHSLDNSMLVFGSAEFKALIKSWEAEFGGKLTAKWIQDNICAYAVGTPVEVFSEGWAEFILSKSPRKPARQLAELLLRAHGKKA